MTGPTAGLLRPDREVYRIAYSGRVHLYDRCPQVDKGSTGAPRAKRAGALWDTEPLCRRCRVLLRAPDLRPGLEVRVDGGGRFHLDPGCPEAGGGARRAEAGGLDGDAGPCPECLGVDSLDRHGPEPGAVPDRPHEVLEELTPEQAGLGG